MSMRGSQPQLRSSEHLPHLVRRERRIAQMHDPVAVWTNGDQIDGRVNKKRFAEQSKWLKMVNVDVSARIRSVQLFKIYAAHATCPSLERQTGGAKHGVPLETRLLNNSWCPLDAKRRCKKRRLLLRGNTPVKANRWGIGESYGSHCSQLSVKVKECAILGLHALGGLTAHSSERINFCGRNLARRKVSAYAHTAVGSVCAPNTSSVILQFECGTNQVRIGRYGDSQHLLPASSSPLQQDHPLAIHADDRISQEELGYGRRAA